MRPYPPLGTLYAAAVTRERGFSVALFDSMLAGSEEDLRQALVLHQPRVLVIYDDDFNYLTKMCLTRMREAAQRMAMMASQSGCTVIVHGSDAVDHVEKYAAFGVSYVVCGEGERTLGELLLALLRNTGSLSSIPGLAYMKDGVVHRTPARAVMKDLDALPFPARDLLDIRSYRTAWTSRHGYFSVNMVTTRGCPFHCNWCAKPLYGQVYNSRSPRNVADELRQIKTAFAPDHIWFCDDIFGLKPGWIGEFAEIVTHEQPVTPFKCLARVDLLLKGTTITDLKRAGCQMVWVGAESGSQKILDAMDKGTTVDQIVEATRRLKEAGISVGFFLQYGYPGETREDIDATLQMVEKCEPDDIGISVSYPLPGTRFYERVKAEMSAKQNWVDSQDLDMMFAGTYSPDYYRVLHRYTHKRFRLRQGLRMWQGLLRAPGALPRRGLRRLGGTLYHALTLPALKKQLRALENQSSRKLVSGGRVTA